MKFISEFIRKNGPEFRALVNGGLPRFLISRNPAPLSEGVPVFCYHLVEAKCFEEDLRFLAENRYGTLFADDMLDHLNRRREFPAKSVVLTFDDGAVNFYRIAFPMLKRYGQKSVLFIAPGLHRSASHEQDSERRLCTWEELQEIHESGLVDIQSHTWSHRSFVKWPEPIPPAGIDESRIDDLIQEAFSVETDLKMARETIEKRFGKTVKHLAWPSYSAEESALRMALSVGYEGIWTGVIPGRPLNGPGQSALEIVRLSGEFLRRLPGAGRQSLTKILSRRYFQAVKMRMRSIPDSGLNDPGE